MYIFAGINKGRSIHRVNRIEDLETLSVGGLISHTHCLISLGTIFVLARLVNNLNHVVLARKKYRVSSISH